MSHSKTIFRAAIAAICMISMLLFSPFGHLTAYASSGYEFILLDTYAKTMNIGEEFYLLAITSTGKKPSFSSSNSSVASVNTYGKVTAKKSGSATITAKIRNGEASCSIKVNKTTIRLGAKSISLECGEQKKLTVSSSTGHPAKFKSSKSSIASVDADGQITAKKPGTASITVTVDKATAICKVTVKKPTVKLSKSSVSLYRKQNIRLSVSTSSKSTPKWKTNKKSVATVTQDGLVTAMKNGTAIITATVDGVSKTCEVTVKKPTVKFPKDSVTLSVGDTYRAKASVSSRNKPEYSTSNSSVATVDENGIVSAIAAGRAYIYAKEDGTKARMTIHVTKE